MSPGKHIGRHPQRARSGYPPVAQGLDDPAASAQKPAPNSPNSPRTAASLLALNPRIAFATAPDTPAAKVLISGGTTIVGITSTGMSNAGGSSAFAAGAPSTDTAAVVASTTAAVRIFIFRTSLPM